MYLIKGKISKYPEFDKEFMDNQKIYAYKSKEKLEPGTLVYMRNYEKYLHVSESTEDNETKFVSTNPEIKNPYSPTQGDRSYLPILHLEQLGYKVFGKHPIVKAIKPNI